MKLVEVRELLNMISSFDRLPFPEGAAITWHEILAGLPFADARQAVLEHYRMPDPQRVTPGDIRKRAAVLAARRAPRPALPAVPHRGERGEMAREAIREMTAAAVARHRAENPEARPYRHRRTPLIRVDA